MDEIRELPPLWLSLCERVGASPDISLDRLRAKLNDAVGRTTLQRIRDGVEGTPLSTFKKLATQLKCAPQELMAVAGEHQPQRSTDWRKAGEIIANQSKKPQQRELLLDFLSQIDDHLKSAQRFAESIPDITER